MPTLHLFPLQQRAAISCGQILPPVRKRGMKSIPVTQGPENGTRWQRAN